MKCEFCILNNVKILYSVGLVGRDYDCFYGEFTNIENFNQRSYFRKRINAYGTKEYVIERLHEWLSNIDFSDIIYECLEDEYSSYEELLSIDYSAYLVGSSSSRTYNQTVLGAVFKMKERHEKD